MTSSRPLVEIDDLRVIFRGDNGRTTHAVDKVDLKIARGSDGGYSGHSPRRGLTIASCLRSRAGLGPEAQPDT